MENINFNISLLRLLYDNPSITQREMAKNLTCSLGKLNYNIKFLLKYEKYYCYRNLPWGNKIDN